jgi:hypothetical protein
MSRRRFADLIDPAVPGPPMADLAAAPGWVLAA